MHREISPSRLIGSHIEDIFPTLSDKHPEQDLASVCRLRRFPFGRSWSETRTIDTSGSLELSDENEERSQHLATLGLALETQNHTASCYRRSR